MIIGLAGRRMGPRGDAEALFPDSSTSRVRERLKALFQAVGATSLVGSGACGADLLAMEVAGELGLNRRMVLPFERARFRATSVADREYAHDWGAVFDRVADEIDARKGLIVLGDKGEDDAAYSAVNTAILDEAERLAREDRSAALAVVVWDGKTRTGADLTAAFADAARARSIPLREVLTTDAANTG
jgi:hypothetical protein